MIYDTFPMNDELDMLEARLVELESVPNLVHVIIEAEVTHQDRPKPSHYLDNKERFAPWAERIRHVWATGLPTVADDPDAWSRERAQRDYAALAMEDAIASDVVLHGDLDELPTALVVRNLRPQGFVALDMRLVCFCVDWLHPGGWRGTVASTVGNLRGSRPFNNMRDARNMAKALTAAGTHMSWLGGTEANLRKLHNFCHPEIAGQIDYGLSGGRNAFYEMGLHVDGTKMLPVDVDASWPRWVYERRCPANWFRPREREAVA